MIDASAAVLALSNAGASRQRLAHEALHAPHLIDVEIAHAFRRNALGGRVSARAGEGALRAWARMGVERHAATGMLPRLWELRASHSAYDATYVALAEVLECPLLTADARLANAHGGHCKIELITS